MEKEVIIEFDPMGDKIGKPTILQLLKKKGVEIDWHCADGYCGMCKCDKPTKGAIKTKEGKEINAVMQKDNEGNNIQILACVSQIDTTKIQLNNRGKGVIGFKFPEEKLKNVKDLKNQNSDKSINNKIKI